LILDDADEMLSMGFKKDLDEILEMLKEVENKWLFSATMPQGIKEIVKNHLSPKALRVEASGKTGMNKNIFHQYLVCEEADKLDVLLQFLKSEKKNRGIIFCRTKAVTDKLGKQLKAKNIASEAIHGDLTQKERDKVMRAFKNESLQILVATDLAARGLDIESLSFVVHYQLPQKDEYYIHRSGRTARAGKEGISLCIINESETRSIKYLERSLGIHFKEIRRIG
jgi:ATP-dependent RNA helicase DeaD